MNVVFFSKYTQKGPSSRYRIFQYLPFYLFEKINIEVNPLLGDDYIENLYNQKSFSKIKILKWYLQRVIRILKLKKDDLVYIEYEFFPYFPAFFEWYLVKIKKIKYIVDYDDAIFHSYDNNSKWIIKLLFSNKISKVIKYSKHVITGSPYLTCYAKKNNKNVTEIPTSIDFDIYNVESDKNKEDGDNVLKIGWIGSKTTSKNIIAIIPALLLIASKYEVKLFLLGFDKTLLHLLEGIDYRYMVWTKETEIEDIKSFDVGIMPLDDTLFNKGKCGFKLIQYMACSLPTISSSLEANVKINRNKKNLHADTNQEWIHAFEKIIKSKNEYITIGKENKMIIEKEYSIQSNAKMYIKIFKKLSN
jgi:glycosyltransferase involved in cell wall biosynthesis